MNTSAPLPRCSAGLTDVGKTRRVNEDAFLDKRICGLWVVADGMGGHQAGDRASQSIVQGLDQVAYCDDIEAYCQQLTTCLSAVNLDLSLEGGKYNPPRVIGSTVAVLVVCGNRGALLWAGDSRVYRLRKGELELLSRDHSQIQEMLDRGIIDMTQARFHPAANVITRAVGGSPLLELETIIFDIEAGDKFLLCTDGLYRGVTDFDMECILNGMTDCQLAAQTLMARALAGDARDNITLVVVDFFGATKRLTKDYGVTGRSRGAKESASSSMESVALQLMKFTRATMNLKLMLSLLDYAGRQLSQYTVINESQVVVQC